MPEGYRDGLRSDVCDRQVNKEVTWFLASLGTPQIQNTKDVKISKPSILIILCCILVCNKYLFIIFLFLPNLFAVDGRGVTITLNYLKTQCMSLLKQT